MNAWLTISTWQKSCVCWTSWSGIPVIMQKLRKSRCDVCAWNILMNCECVCVCVIHNFSMAFKTQIYLTNTFTCSLLSVLCLEYYKTVQGYFVFGSKPWTAFIRMLFYAQYMQKTTSMLYDHRHQSGWNNKVWQRAVNMRMNVIVCMWCEIVNLWFVCCVCRLEQ